MKRNNSFKGETVRPYSEYADKLKYLTSGKDYTVTRDIDEGDNITVIGDDGKHRPHSFRHFWILPF
jgi:hypothetical protein